MTYQSSTPKGTLLKHKDTMLFCEFVIRKCYLTNWLKILAKNIIILSKKTYGCLWGDHCHFLYNVDTTIEKKNRFKRK